MGSLYETTIALSNGTVTDLVRPPLPQIGVPKIKRPRFTPGPISRRLLPPGEYDRRYWQDFFCIRHYELNDVAFCQITLAYFCLCYATAYMQLHVMHTREWPRTYTNTTLWRMVWLLTMTRSVIIMTVDMLTGTTALPEDCVDKPSYANCELILEANMCRHPYFRVFCCRSCHLAGRLPWTDWPLTINDDQSMTNSVDFTFVLYVCSLVLLARRWDVRRHAVCQLYM